MINVDTMQNKFSNCCVWVSPSTSDLKLDLILKLAANMDISDHKG